jgi:DNA polymerase III delta prime subunit
MGFETRLFGQSTIFQTIRDSFTNLPHIFLTGPPGSGKTTFLEDFLTLLQEEAPFQVDSVLWLTSEKDRGIHTIRDKVNDFCKRTHSKPNTLRWIIIDDADTLPLISQQALRRPMETYSHLTRFIFASRYVGHLIEPLRSRCLHIEIEPISPMDAIPKYITQYGIIFDTPAMKEEFFSFCLKHFTMLHEIKSILLLYSSYRKEGYSHQIALTKLHSLLPSSDQFTNRLIQAIGSKDESTIQKCITDLYLHGYLLDDILLSIEKSISIFPSISPSFRFSILQFTMLGWISIQQGKEHWLDTMDIVEYILQHK